MTDGQWIKSPTARRVIEYWADARPAWLWSGDGSELLWRNGAARFFMARIKKNGPKLLSSPTPIKGQVARLIRLGSTGRTSLSRIQFLAGDKPISATCAVTPLQVADGDTGHGGLSAVLKLAKLFAEHGADFRAFRHGPTRGGAA